MASVDLTNHDTASEIEECLTTVYLDYDAEVGSYTDDSDKIVASTGFHILYLQPDPIEFMFPVRFEEGMGYEECENYYKSVNPQYKQRKARSSRLKTKSEIHQETMGELRSCLRKPGSYQAAARSAPGGLRRNVSFSEIPSVDTPPARELNQKWKSLRDMDSPRVAFERHIHVITIYPFYEYPDDVWNSIWNTSEQMMRMIKKATRDQRREELAKQRRSEHDEEVHMLSREDEAEASVPTKRRGEGPTILFPDDELFAPQVQDHPCETLKEDQDCDCLSDESDTDCSTSSDTNSPASYDAPGTLWTDYGMNQLGEIV